MRLRTEDHVGMWRITRDTPMHPRLYRAPLTFAGPAATV